MINYKNLFVIQDQYKDGYNQKINSGRKLIYNSKIVVVGLCRNLEKHIEKNIKKIEQSLTGALDYRIILYENDSIDDTKNKILDLCKNNKKIILLSDNHNRKQFNITQSQDRIKALAEYRNTLLHYVQDNYSDYNFVIVIDMDFIDFSDEGVVNSFGWLNDHENVGGIAGNSFQLKDIFDNSQLMLWNYDCWAFRGSWWHNLQTQIKNEFNNYDNMLWFGFWILPVGSPIIVVNSAFGGCCIYRMKYYLSGNYDSYDCEHVVFNFNILQKNKNFKLYLNPSQTMLMP
jgi:hypothetical protein